MRKITRIALATVALGALSTTALAQDKVTISFLHKWPEPENMPFFEQAVAAFEAANPEVDVRMEAVADEPYKDKIRVLMASGEVPDIYFSWSGEFGRKFARAGRALDLTDALSSDAFQGRFPEAALDPYEFEGRIYGMPINVDAKFMLYNQAIFAEHRLSEPTTWDEFEALLAKLQETGVTPIAFGNQFPWAASHYIGDLNAKLVPNETRLADYNLESSDEEMFRHPGYVRALQEFSKLQEQGHFNRGPNALTHAIARGSFAAGRTAMMYMELVEFTELDGSRLAEAGWDFFPLPPFADGEGSAELLTGAPDGFMVSATSAHPEVAIRFLEFLTSPEQARLYTAQTGMTSAVTGAIDESNASPQMLQALETIEQFEGLALWLDTDMDARIAEVYLAGSQAILNGTETPEQVMGRVRDTALKVKSGVAG